MKRIVGLIASFMLMGGVAWADDADTWAINTIILESANQSLEGQVAVAEVIRNRAKRDDLSHKEVVLAPWQFSCWNNRLEAQKRLKRASGETFQRAARAWEVSKTSNLTNGALHYHTKAVHPKWSRGHVPSVIIGEHRFYNDVK